MFVLWVNQVVFYLIGIYSMKGWTATKPLPGMELQEKQAQND